jgi:hypothetical protein
VAQIVDASERCDSDGELGGLPLARAEVMQIEVGAAKGREQEVRVSTRRQASDRLERDLLKGHGADAAFGLGALQPPVAVCAPHIDDARSLVDVAPLERDPFPWS